MDFSIKSPSSLKTLVILECGPMHKSDFTHTTWCHSEDDFSPSRSTQYQIKPGDWNIGLILLHAKTLKKVDFPANPRSLRILIVDPCQEKNSHTPPEVLVFLGDRLAEIWDIRVRGCTRTVDYNTYIRYLYERCASWSLGILVILKEVRLI